MKKTWFLLPSLLILAAGCAIAFFLLRTPAVYSNDVITFRRIASETAQHWSRLEEAEYPVLAWPFCVIDTDGTVRFCSDKDAVTDAGEALASGNPILDVQKDGTLLGKVIITKNPGEELSCNRRMTAFFLLSVSVLCVFFIGLYYLFLDRNIARPFRELERFAARVAGGDLDFPLRRTKSNLFGAFTESFDMMREQLKLAREREFLANRRQKELVASLSHDIKTPVTAIRLTSELLLELEPEERLRDKIGMIYQKTEQIESLVNNLFHTTLQDMEQLSVTPSEVYSSSLARMLRNADYGERVRFSPIPDCILYLDELRFMQVLSNIFNNSCKYADTPITVETVLVDSYLKMSVSDSGPGVSEEELPLLFNQFYRGGNAAGKSGSGLGLYICKKLMEQMQGDIYCTCSQNRFTVVLMIRLV